jgi:hypothetical protein
MFPSDWAHQTGQRKKRKATVEESIAIQVQSQHEPESEPSAASENLQLPSLILRNLNTVACAPATPDELNLDVILSRVPYKEILENLYGRDEYAAKAVPVVSRAYEESFMREPNKGERACASGELCECNFIDPCMPFTAVEFLLPGEDYPQHPQMCVLCCRKVTQKMFYDVLFTGKDVHCVIQRYGNICGVQGEYARECMLVCPPHAPLHCMPRPVMSHQRNKYRVRIANGLKCLDQIRVRHEDFATPSTEGQS